MTEIKPFKAVYYNLKEKIGNPSDLVCPPYDVISKEQQEEYYKVNPYNFIRLEFPQETPRDTDKDNRYTRAKKTFDEWLTQGILVQDSKPGIYYYKQEFKIRGQKYSRLGFISLLKIDDEAVSKIHPHENTHAAAKTDRLQLWSTLSANLSCIFVCFADPNRKVEKIFIKEVSPDKPLIDAVDQDGVRHIIWRLNDPALIGVIEQTLAGQNLFIADGHHRFEVAKQLRRQEIEKRNGKFTGEEPFNYVMTYFTSMDSKDLQIFPIHRVVRKMAGYLSFLENNFRIDRIKTKEELAIMLAKAGQNEHAFGLYDREGARLLRLKNKALIEQFVTSGSREYRSLDSAILKAMVFDPLGVPSEDIVYTKDQMDAIRMVEEGQAEASFILNPVHISQLKAIALNGEKMPPKTTYFYPKALSGLTVYRLE